MQHDDGISYHKLLRRTRDNYGRRANWKKRGKAQRMDVIAS
jgi:hypothetical protein